MTGDWTLSYLECMIKTIEVMIKRILVLIIVFLGILQMNAQTVSLSILKGGKWEWTLPESRVFSFQFSKTQVKEDVYYVRLKKSHGATHRFYLADEPTSQFNGKMVGKSQSGKYLVYETMTNRATSFEILSASNTQIKMKHPDGDIFVLTRR